MGKSSSTPESPDYVAVARAQGEENIKAAQEQASLDRYDQTNPYGSRTWSQDDQGNWSVADALSPDQQTLLNQRTTQQIGINQTAANALPQLDQLGQQIDTSGLNPRTTSIDASVANTQLPVEDYSADRQQVIDTLYGMNTKQLDPQYQQQENELRTRLLNSGIQEGTEAWNRQWDDFGRSRTAAYGDARDRAILAGGQEQSRLLSDALRGYQFENDASAQQFGQNLSNANLGNTQRDAQYAEDVTGRQMSLNELMQLFGMTGGETSPGFISPSGTQSVSPVDVTGAANSQYGADLNAANASNAAKNATTSGAAALASAALIAF